MSRIFVIRLLFLVIFLLNSHSRLAAQNDSLIEGTEEYFTRLSYNVDKVSDYRDKLKIVDSIITSAKKFGNRLRLISGYHAKGIFNEGDLRLVYLDSAISVAKKDPTDFYPSMSYMEKGDIYLENNDFQKALENYVLFKSTISEEVSPYLSLEADFSIANIRRVAGRNVQALQEYKNIVERLDSADEKIFDKEKLYFHLYTVQATTYNSLRKPDSALYYNKKARSFLSNELSAERSRFFILNEAISKVLNDESDTAIDLFEKVTPYFDRNNEATDLSILSYFHGNAILNQGDTTRAVELYKRVDSIYSQGQYILPESQKAYRKLIDIYKTKGDLENQLYYTNQLLKVDSSLTRAQSQLYSSILNDFDIKNLEEQRQLIKQELEISKFDVKLVLLILMIVIIAAALIIYRQISLSRARRDNYRALLLKLNELQQKELRSPNTEPNQDLKEKDQRDLNLPYETIDSISENLEKFEEDQGFIDSSITLNKLAQSFNTNTTYLSKYINSEKGKTFSQYLNDLRIEYFLLRFENDPKLRLYSIKAISQEVGFKTPASFSNYFEKYTGIKPSYFIQKHKNDLQ